MIRRVEGASMLPFYKPGRLVLASRNLKKLKLGDVVILSYKSKEIIKRISKMNHDQIFVLGDNIEKSTDSRSFGWIDQSNIIARVIR